MMGVVPESFVVIGQSQRMSFSIVPADLWVMEGVSWGVSELLEYLNIGKMISGVSIMLLVRMSRPLRITLLLLFCHMRNQGYLV